MKYHFVDRLEDFEFHDSAWALISWANDDLVLSVRHLNVHKSALPEPSTTDMEIEVARMTFRGFSQLSYEPSRTWKIDENGKSYTNDPKITHTDEAAKSYFIAELECPGMCIFNFACDGQRCEIGGCGIDPYFTFCFSFQQVEIAWDTFRKPAWYTQTT